MSPATRVPWRLQKRCGKKCCVSPKGFLHRRWMQEHPVLSSLYIGADAFSYLCLCRCIVISTNFLLKKIAIHMCTYNFVTTGGSSFKHNTPWTRNTTSLSCPSSDAGVVMHHMRGLSDAVMAAMLASFWTFWLIIIMYALCVHAYLHKIGKLMVIFIELLVHYCLQRLSWKSVH